MNYIHLGTGINAHEAHEPRVSEIHTQTNASYGILPVSTRTSPAYGILPVHTKANPAYGILPVSTQTSPAYGILPVSDDVYSYAFVTTSAAQPTTATKPVITSTSSVTPSPHPDVYPHKSQSLTPMSF